MERIVSARSHDRVQSKRGGKKDVPVVKRGKTTGRGEEWIVARTGAATTIITSPSSAQAMDSTSRVYADTLKRLAEK